MLAYVNALHSATLLATRYVDDIFVCSVDELEITYVKEIAFETSPELVFTTGELIDDYIQYLDLRLLVS